MAERMVRVETNIVPLMAANVRTAAFENTVLEALTTIKLRQEDSMSYQKLCDAERDAHEKRIAKSENTLEAVAKASDSHEIRMNKIEISLVKFDTARRALLWFSGVQCTVLLTLAGFAVAWFKHG